MYIIKLRTYMDMYCICYNTYINTHAFVCIYNLHMILNIDYRAISLCVLLNNQTILYNQAYRPVNLNHIYYSSIIMYVLPLILQRCWPPTEFTREYGIPIHDSLVNSVWGYRIPVVHFVSSYVSPTWILFPLLTRRLRYDDQVSISNGNISESIAKYEGLSL